MPNKQDKGIDQNRGNNSAFHSPSKDVGIKNNLLVQERVKIKSVGRPKTHAVPNCYSLKTSSVTTK